MLRNTFSALLSLYGDEYLIGSEIESPKSYGAAVATCMIFGTMGIHHFYLGNWLHGLFDLGLFVIAVTLLITGDSPGAILMAIVCILVDVAHTLVVTYRLLVGKCRDGAGLLVVYPGQIQQPIQR